MIVEKGTVAEVTYSTYDEHGNLLDTNESSQPIEFVVGYSSTTPEILDAVMGMTIGEEKVIHAEKPLLPHDPEKILQLSKTVHNTHSVNSSNNTITLTDGTEGLIIDEKPAYWIVDTNHPLSGKKLTIKIKICCIRPASLQERVTGIVQAQQTNCCGPGGCC